ncbi:MAG: UvrD-helicase domain-containing protein, partial [Clostridia bacterium]|nr:UvrD-helicase domain-containing protein [Clostridia bacterium]
MSFISKDLNDRQKEAVYAGEGPVLVLAGAGSGKTRVLTSRVAHLVMDRNVSSSSILAITFTNKAAREIHRRVEKLFGGRIWFPWIGTFHSMCLKMLRMFPESVGYKPNFVIYDSEDQKTLVKDCLRELNIDAKLFPPKLVIYHINRSKDELAGPDEFTRKNSGDYKMSAIARVYEVYQKHLVSNNAMDFGDLIANAVRMLMENKNACDYFQSAFRHILIDEYQDTNTAQYRLARILSERHRNIFVVGDDDQSIYGWRGANIRNILDFEKDYPGCLVVRLEQNYRSTTNILSAANDVILNNTGRKGKTLWTDRGEGKRINYYRAASDSHEAYFIASTIEKYIAGGRSHNDFAVLYRVNAQSRSIEQALRDRKIPYRIYGGLSYYQRKEVKDMLAYLRLVVNPDDGIQLKRVINEPRRGIGKTSLNRIETYAIENQTSMYRIALDIGDYPDLRGCAGKVSEFTGIIEDLRKSAAEKPPEDLFDEALDKTHILEQYKVENTVESRTRIENIRELKSAIVSMKEEYLETAGRELTLEDFLNNVTLSTDADEESDGSFVSIMTLHSAKGLEFPIVFITGMEENIFPSIMSGESDDRIEEERRLCYVGITRAMEEVYLLNTQQRTIYGRTQLNPASRFLREINARLINNISAGGAYGKTAASGRTNSYDGIEIRRGGVP